MEEYMTLENITGLVTAVASAIAAIAAAVATILSSRTVTIMRKQHEENIKLSAKSAESTIFMNCLSQYLEIMSKEARSIQENQMSYAYDSQRALIDLVWFEFNLWERNLITDNAFYAWMTARRRSYNSDKPDLKFEDKEDTWPVYLTNYATQNIVQHDEKRFLVVSYKRVWDYLVSIGYYPEGDEYLQIMRNIHLNDLKIEEILRNAKKEPIL
jgi:hypothetical protein